MSETNISRISDGSIPPEFKPLHSEASVKRTVTMSTASTISQAQAEALSDNFPDIPTLPAQLQKEKPPTKDEIMLNTLNTIVDLSEEIIAILSPPKKPAAEEGEVSTTEAGAEGEVEATRTSPVPEKKDPVSLLDYLKVLTKALKDLRWMEQRVQGDLTQQSFALKILLANLAELNGSKNVEKKMLIKELEYLRDNEMQSISTGQRLILGDYPEIMLSLVKFGVVPPCNGGGPYDGMAKHLAASGTPPYDDPMYAAMAMALPVGWEELSASEVNEVIAMLEASMDAGPVTMFSDIFGTMVEDTTNVGMKIIKSMMKTHSDVMQMLLLRKQLDDLKGEMKHIRTGDRIILGENPDIMLKLFTYGIIPPTAGGGPYDGMAIKAANSGQPPYDNPVYASMARSLPSGWEELSMSELNQVIAQLDAKIQQEINDKDLKFKPIADRVYGGGDRGIITQGLMNILSSSIGGGLFQRGGIGAGKPIIIIYNPPDSEVDPFLNHLINSVNITVNVYITLFPPKTTDLVQIGTKMLEIWVKNQIVDKIMKDFFGNAQTNPLGREFMANAMVSYALISTLLSGKNSTPDKLMHALRTIEKNTPFAIYAGIAIMMAESQKQQTSQRIESIVKELLKRMEATQDQLENIQLMIALIRELIKMVLMMIANADITPSEIPEAGEEGLPAMDFQV